MKSPKDTLQLSLIRHLQKPVEVVLNKNSSTFIKVQLKRPIVASLHEAFLDAPDTIVSSLASFISGNKNEEERLYSYMVEYFKRTLPTKAASPKGNTYDLDSLFDHLNQERFNNRLSLTTTWWKKRHVSRASFTLGVFVDTLRLIKIDSLLDTPTIPQYVVESVLHHEMLHAVIPPRKDRTGRLLVHTPEFRKQERSFPFFYEADTWLRNNRSLFFKK